MSAEPFIPPAPVVVPRQSTEIEIASIDAGDRLRPVDRAAVEALAASFVDVGQRQPITIRQGEDNRVLLVAGAHRVAAAQLLGWETIRAEWLDVGATEARLVEIDENLIRAELTALDRAVFLAERKQVYELLHPEARHGGDRRKKVTGDQVAMFATCPSFTAEAMKRTGLSERSIQYAVALVAELGPEVIAAIRGTSLVDNGAQLRALADVEPEHRLLVAQEIAKGAPNVARAKNKAGIGEVHIDDPDQKALKAFLAIWTRCSSKARKMIRAEIDKYEQPAPAPKQGRG
jgi:ParB family transcriptional regulator, chromosome partitioning protein